MTSRIVPPCTNPWGRSLGPFASHTAQVLALGASLLLTACPQGNKKASLPESSPTEVTEKGNTTGAQPEEATTGSVRGDGPSAPKPPEAAPQASGQGSAPQAEPGAPASLATPARDLSPANQAARGDTARVAGQVVSARQSDLSFKVSGHIAGIAVRTGDTVKRGQKLANLDALDYDLRSRISAGAVQQARIAFEQAKKDLQREEDLRKEGATTEVNLERATNLLTQTRIGLSNAELQARQAAKALEDATLVAPFDGVIAKRFKSEGEHVAVGTAVFRLSADSDLEVSLRVPEYLMASVRTGDRLPLFVPSTKKTTELVVARVVPVVEESTRTFEVIGLVSSAEAQLAPGQFVEAAIQSKNK